MKTIASSRLPAAALAIFAAWPASADTIGCVTTTWKLVGANHKVCVEAFHDPKVPGVTCQAIYDSNHPRWKPRK